MRRRRDHKTGRILGNLYVLHDEPLTPFEAMQLDPDYLGLVSQALAHPAKAVQLVGFHTLREVATDPLLNGRTLPTQFYRCWRNGWRDTMPWRKVIHSRTPTTNPKKAWKPCFGFKEPRLRIPKQG